MRRHARWILVGILATTGCAPGAVRKAQELIQAGKVAEARGVLELQCKSQPKDWRSLVLLGRVNLLELRPEEASAAFDKALPLSSKVAPQVGPAYADGALEAYAKVNGELEAATKAMTAAFAEWEKRRPTLPIQAQFSSQPTLREAEARADKAREAFLLAAPVLIGYIEKARQYGAEASGETLSKLEAIDDRLKTIQREDARARTTAARMRTISIAVEAYSVDYNVYPKASSIEELLRFVAPTYVRDADSLHADGWGTRFEIASGGDDYEIVSAGSDRTFIRESWSQGGLSPTPAGDVVYRRGEFVKQWEWMGL